MASFAFGLDRPPNFEGHAWHLVVAHSDAELERATNLDGGMVRVLLESARRKLAAARELRVRPGLDDKVLTSWNALMIAGMARASRAFGKPEWLASARRALEFIRTTLWKDARLLATAKDGRAHLDAYLDDHAFLLAALIEVMQASFEPRDLAWAREIAAVLVERFHDPERGGFFFTSHGHEPLIHRPKPGPDNATPSGNGMAAWALNRLSFLTGEPRFAEAARDTVALFWPQIAAQPSAFGTLLAALEEQLVPPRTVIVTGDREGFGPWRELLDGAYLPTTLAVFIPAGTAGLPEPLAKPAESAVRAWVCEGAACLAPVASPRNCASRSKRRECALPRHQPTPTGEFDEQEPFRPCRRRARRGLRGIRIRRRRDRPRPGERLPRLPLGGQEDRGPRLQGSRGQVPRQQGRGSDAHQEGEERRHGRVGPGPDAAQRAREGRRTSRSSWSGSCP